MFLAKLLCTGVASWLAIQTFFNVGGIIGLIPMTGVPLPLVSQGGFEYYGCDVLVWEL